MIEIVKKNNNCNLRMKKLKILPFFPSGTDKIPFLSFKDFDNNAMCLVAPITSQILLMLQSLGNKLSFRNG